MPCNHRKSSIILKYRPHSLFLNNRPCDNVQYNSHSGYCVCWHCQLIGTMAGWSCLILITMAQLLPLTTVHASKIEFSIDMARPLFVITHCLWNSIVYDNSIVCHWQLSAINNCHNIMHGNNIVEILLCISWLATIIHCVSLPIVWHKSLCAIHPV